MPVSKRRKKAPTQKIRQRPFLSVAPGVEMVNIKLAAREAGVTREKFLDDIRGMEEQGLIGLEMPDREDGKPPSHVFMAMTPLGKAAQQQAREEETG